MRLESLYLIHDIYPYPPGADYIWSIPERDHIQVQTTLPNGMSGGEGSATMQEVKFTFLKVGTYTINLTEQSPYYEPIQIIKTIFVK